jgi:hypothetical protein
MSTEKQINNRMQMPGRMAKEVGYQILSLSRTDLGAYTYERTKSDFKDARRDLSIYDAAGKLVLLGRDFGDRTFFWPAQVMDVRLKA